MYKITIEETKTETKLVRGQWAKCGQEKKEDPYSADEYYMSDTFGYAPDREDEVTETKKIFEQVVDELDIVSVIMAINSEGE